MADKKLTMKLLIDTKANKVLFAEAGKDVIDFLFSLLGMPVGSIVKLLSKDRMVGCVANLYNSLEGLDTSYLLPNRDKADLLSPGVSAPAFTHNTLLLPAATSSSNKYYLCSSCYNHLTNCCETQCPNCRRQMTRELTYVDRDTGKVDATVEGLERVGLVRGVVTYTIMDDLTVTPMSTISSITLLNKLQVKDMTVLQEKSVELGFEQGLGLLQASLQSTTALTHVFLGEFVVETHPPTDIGITEPNHAEMEKPAGKEPKEPSGKMHAIRARALLRGDPQGLRKAACEE